MGKQKKKLFIFAAILLLIGAFGYKSLLTQKKHFQLHTYQLKNGQWAYKIYQKDRLLIDQDTIPGGEGGTAFSTKEQATAIGQLVVDKLEKGIFPPTITKEDLIKHKVLTP